MAVPENILLLDFMDSHWCPTGNKGFWGLPWKTLWQYFSEPPVTRIWIVTLRREVKDIPVFPNLKWSRNIVFPIASGRTSFAKNATLSNTGSKIKLLIFCTELASKDTIKNRTVQLSCYLHIQGFKESKRKISEGEKQYLYYNCMAFPSCPYCLNTTIYTAFAHSFYK